MNDPARPEVHATATLPSHALALYESIVLGTLMLPEGETLAIVAGLSEELVRELQAISLSDEDESLMRQTSDRKRFGEGSYEAWYAKDRYPFALVNAEGHLAALMWLGPEAAPGELGEDDGLWDTIAFRSYPPYRGKGIMTPFSRFCIEAYRTAHSGRRIWLETDADNEAGKALYGKLGFRERGYRDSNGRLLMEMA